jgi:hypothetical protein
MQSTPFVLCICYSNPMEFDFQQFVNFDKYQ